MTNYRSLNHTKWTCQYHVVFIPKYRKKVIYGELRRYLGEVLRCLAQHRESEVEEGHLMADHVHIMLSIPPKYSVAQVIGYIKGKSASSGCFRRWRRHSCRLGLARRELRRRFCRASRARPAIGTTSAWSTSWCRVPA